MINWEAIGAIGEIAGAIAVVATLVYLAIQIRQNTTTARASATREIHDSLIAAHRPIYSSTEVARVVRVGSFEPDSLSPDERMQFLTAIYNLFSAFEIYHSQHRAGLIDEEIFSRVSMGIRNHISTPGVQDWWSRYKPDFSADFVERVERELANAKEQSTQYSKQFDE